MPTFELPPARPENPNLMIGIPSYGDMLYDELSILLLDLGMRCKDAGIGMTLHCVGRTRIEKSRNIIASLFHADEAFSHLLFIDSDMSFPADLVFQMIAFDKPFIGVASPSRRVHWPSVHRAGKVAEDDSDLAATGHRFIHQLRDPANPGATGEISIESGFSRAHAVGGGVLLLKREVFAEIAAEFPGLREPADPQEMQRGLSEYWGFFDTLRPSATEKTLSEDLSFCHRWREGCGGEIWCNVSSPITHYGASAMRGRLQDQLAKGWLD